MTVSPTRGVVGSTFDLTIVGFPANTQVTILFIGSTGVNVNLGTDPTSVYRGADNMGRVLLYAPNPFVSGSSLSQVLD